MSQSVLILIAVALFAANLPFFVERIFFVLPVREGEKRLVWRLAELIVLYFIVGFIARLLEQKLGPVPPQHWEFYAVTACLFLVFAYPGFVYRYFMRGKRKARVAV